MNNDMLLPVGLTTNIKPEDIKWNGGDLISREALKKDLASYDREFAPDWVLNLINNAPPVEVFTLEDMQNNFDLGAMSEAGKHDRPQGEWINREAISNTIFPFWERYECNQCHKFNGYSNFCPNCGAEMRGKENEESD